MNSCAVNQSVSQFSLYVRDLVIYCKRWGRGCWIGDEVMDEIHNREEPELQWMILERRLIAMLQHRPSVEVGE